MNTITHETSDFTPLNEPVAASSAIAAGSKLHSTYFEFHINLPVVLSATQAEMSDEELLVAAEKAGTFDFLTAPEEDGYNDLLPPRE